MSEHQTRVIILMFFMIKALIFDMDGVLVDTEPYHEAFLTKVLKGLGIDVTGDLLGELRGTDAKTFWSTVSKRYGLPEQTEDFIEETRQKYLEFLQVQYTLRPVDGALEALKILKKKSIPSDMTQEHIRSIGLGFALVDERWLQVIRCHEQWGRWIGSQRGIGLDFLGQVDQ